MKYQLMFDQPSLRFDEGLPIGNGRFGLLFLYLTVEKPNPDFAFRNR